MEECLAASFMARTRLQGIVTAMNAGGSSGAGPSSSSGAQSQTHVLDWISGNRVQMIIQVLSGRPDEVVTQEQKTKLDALSKRISQAPVAMYQVAPKKVATVWLMAVRTIIDNDDQLLQWAVDTMVREAKEKAARKRPIDDVAAPAEAPGPERDTVVFRLVVQEGFGTGDVILLTMINDDNVTDNASIRLPEGAVPGKSMNVTFPLPPGMSRKGVRVLRTWKKGEEPPPLTAGQPPAAPVPAPVPAPAPVPRQVAVDALNTFLAGSAPASAPAPPPAPPAPPLAPDPAPTESWDDVYDRELAYVAGEIKTPPWQLAGAVLPELRWTYAQFVPVDDYESQVGWGKPDGHLFDYTHPFSEVNVNAKAADDDDAGRQATQRSVVREWVRLPANRTFRENNQTWRANWTNQQMQVICKYVAEHDDLHGHLSPGEKVAMAQHLHNQWIVNLKEEVRFWGANFTSEPQSGEALPILEECRNHGIDPFADLSSAAYEPAALRNAAQQHLFRAQDFWAVHAMRANVQQTDAWQNEHARLLREYSAIMNDATKPHAERQQAADRHEATLCLQLTGHDRAPQRPTYPGGPSAQKQARPKARPWDGVRGENDKRRIKAAVAKDAGLEARIFQAWRDAGYQGRDEVVAHDDGTYPPAPLILAPLYRRIMDLLSASEAAMALLGASGANSAGATERREPAVHMDLT